MSREELLDIIQVLKINYPTFIVNDEVECEWFKVLNNFKYEEVMSHIKIALKSEQYRDKCPTAYYLIQGLTPVNEKISFEKRIVFCPLCKRALAVVDEKKHFERCSSVRYMANQYKKWTNRELNKKELYQMSDDEFEDKYNKLLRYIQNHTNDYSEKTRIEFVFNPPNPIIAKKFLGNI